MRTRLHTATSVLILALLLVAAYPSPSFGAEPQSQGDPSASLFGMTSILPDSFASIVGLAPARWSSLAREAGAHVNRWQFSWADMERSKGRLDPSSADPVVEAASANDFTVLGVLVGTPAWAGGETTQVPANLELPFTHPDNYWARFVYNVVLHYRDRVRYWEIWNEPNLWQFWSGRPEDYYRLLKVAYQAAKAADPSAQVLFGGLSGQDLSFLERVLHAGEADPDAPAAGYFFDIFAWHAYSRASQHYDGTVSYRARLAEHRLSKPIWITESNIPAWNDAGICADQCSPTQWSATLEEQASYVLQAYAYGLAAGVEHLSMYRASDVGERDAWGLLQTNGAPRPAYYAYATASRYLAGGETASLERGAGYDRVDLLSPGRRVTVLWAVVPSIVRAGVKANGGHALLLDKYGNWLSVRPDLDGLYTLYLPAATSNRGITARDYVVGGEPYILIQPH